MSEDETAVRLGGVRHTREQTLESLCPGPQTLKPKP